MFWKTKKVNEGEASVATIERTAEELEQDKARAAEEKARELEILRQMDAEARKTLQGDYLGRYLLAKELGLDCQAEIARIEGITNTTFIDLEEQEWLLRKKMTCHMGYSVGGEHYSYPDLKVIHSAVSEYPGKIARGAMLRFQELNGTGVFEEIRILHFDIGADPLMYGVKTWNGKKLHFNIMLWE